jgi:hypothetical protein
MLQEAVAHEIRAEVGTQVHVSNSLHVYLDEHGQRITEAMQKRAGDILIVPPVSRMFDYPIERDFCHWEHTVRYSGMALDDSDEVLVEPFFIFARDFLRTYRVRGKQNKLDNLAALKKKWGNNFLDWTEAARLFLDEPRRQGVDTHIHRPED